MKFLEFVWYFCVYKVPLLRKTALFFSQISNLPPFISRALSTIISLSHLTFFRWRDNTLFVLLGLKANGHFVPFALNEIRIYPPFMKKSPTLVTLKNRPCLAERTWESLLENSDFRASLTVPISYTLNRPLLTGTEQACTNTALRMLAYLQIQVFYTNFLMYVLGSFLFQRFFYILFYFFFRSSDWNSAKDLRLTS